MADIDNSVQLTDEKRLEWSRHYDSLLWHTIAIFTAGVGTLLGVSFDGNATRPWPEFGGLALVVLGVFYVASFRSFRSKLHNSITNRQLIDLVSNPSSKKYLHQWEVFLFSFFVVGELFVYKLAIGTSCFWIALVCGLISLPLVLFFVVEMVGPSEANSSSTVASAIDEE